MDRLIELLKIKELGAQEKIKGWVRNHRKSKDVGFIDIYDGSQFNATQLIYDNSVNNANSVKIGAAISADVELIPSTVEGREPEWKILSLEVVGDCPDDFPIQPKKHTLEFLREVGYLRNRTRLFQAVFRVRSAAYYVIHEYFMKNGFLNVAAPILTGIDGEGAGNLFDVTTKTKDNFFGKPTSLCVTGQLEGETFALAFGKIYLFGPSFRAENSNTKTHLNEYWHIEPEIAFCHLPQLMDFEEDWLKTIAHKTLLACPDEIAFLSKYNNVDLEKRINNVVNSKVTRIKHEDAIELMLKSGKNFEINPDKNEDLAKEHEKFLTEEYFKAPVFVTNYPKEVKAFYMLQNADGRTVDCVDFLLPDAGEVMGGSEREYRYDVLESKMKTAGVSTEDMYWYLNLRKFGGCPHSGCGMGFERFLMWLTGMQNIRDVIPYYRVPNSCEF
ncbi:MAG: asparagine--tRNA ligase [Deltaproteobacteria bacterium]|jgi:asparaginyl-tRNA synthetase|nr:asparagine--tRNA ligase [Deltaproteobacteria bacterium]